MKPTHAINITGNPRFVYTRASHTNIKATVRKWLREYAEDWDSAYAEKAERERAPENVTKMKRAAK